VRITDRYAFAEGQDEILIATELPPMVKLWVQLFDKYNNEIWLSQKLIVSQANSSGNKIDFAELITSQVQPMQDIGSQLNFLAAYVAHTN
jgi:hypothetical protein